MVKEVNKTGEKLTRLQRIGLYFFHKRETSIVFWFAIVILGVLCYTTLMQRQGFPNVDVPISVVSGTYFVNDKQKVDSEVAEPASNIIKNIPQVKSVTSQASSDFFLLTVEYKDGTSSADGNSLVSEALTSSKKLPSTATLVFKAINAGRFAEQSDLLLSVSSKNDVSAQQLQFRAQAVALKMKELEGVQKSTALIQVEQGIDPSDGSVKSEQRAFDRIGYHDASGAIEYYNSATIGLQAKPSTDALKLYDQVAAKINEIQADSNFSDIRIKISADFAESIRNQVSNLQTNLFEGLLVVIIVCCLLISWRAGIATALSMATVLLMTIAVLWASGTSLNTITLFALILGLGLIVDDTTIMVEAIDAASNTSDNKAEIVAKAIKRVARASLSGTLVTMLAFAPMLFVSGILGSFIRILPISIILALGVSLLVSLTLVPFFGHFLIRPGTKKKTRNPVAVAESWVARKLSSHVRLSRDSRTKRLLYGGGALLFSLLLFLGSVPYFSKLKFDIFPNTKDSNQLTIVLTFPDGDTIAQAQSTTDRADIIIGDTLGKNLSRIAYNSSGSADTATANIQLRDLKQRQTKSPVLIDNLQKAFSNFDGAHVKVNQVDAGPPKDDYPFSVRIFDNDTTKAAKLAQNIALFLDGKDVKRSNGTVAKISRVQISNSATILRSHGDRYVQVGAGFDAADTSALLDPARQLVEAYYTDSVLSTYGIKKDKVVFDYGNEASNQDSFKSMLLAFPILFIAIFLLLLYQFRSFLQPLLIFTAIPFSFFGVAAGLYYTDNPLSFFVLVGFFALIGIAVNNTILLTDFANQARDAGADKYEAMAQAVKARFRPLITTSLTSVVALIPLALSDPFWQSLAVTLIFGLLSSTLLVIIAFPYLYLITEWLRSLSSRGVNRLRRRLS